MIQIEDNGSGVPDHLKQHLFDPFVTTKPNGTGLGLALVAKIINDHGGIIELRQRSRNAPSSACCCPCRTVPAPTVRRTSRRWPTTGG